jgi:hypothetical protein
VFFHAHLYSILIIVPMRGRFPFFDIASSNVTLFVKHREVTSRGLASGLLLSSGWIACSQDAKNASASICMMAWGQEERDMNWLSMFGSS